MRATLQYELGPADLEAFWVHHATHAPYIVARNRCMRWVWFGTFALLALVISFESISGSVVFLGLSVISLVFYVRVNRWWYVRHNRRINAGPDGPRVGVTKLELADRHLLIDAPEVSANLELSAIRRIDESHSHYFIYLGPISAGIIPKVAYDAESFVQALRDAVAAA